jgi:hypothetical protein
LITVIQIFLTALGAFSAIGGTLYETRKKGKGGGLTRWGKISVIVAVLSFAVTGGLEIYKADKNEEERIKADRATQEQLNEIRRSVYATSGMRGSFALVYPLATDGTSKYQTRMSEYGKQWQPDNDNLIGIPGIAGDKGSADGKHLTSVTFNGTSPLAPIPAQEVDEAITFDLSALKVGIYGRNKDTKGRPDLSFPLAVDARREKLGELYNFERTDVTVWTESEPIEHSRNALIRSVQDLLGAHLVIDVPHDTWQLSQVGRARYTGQNNQANVMKMWGLVRLKWIQLELIDWGTLCLSGSDMKREDHGAGPRYTLELPSSMEKLSDLGDASKCDLEF